MKIDFDPKAVPREQLESIVMQQKHMIEVMNDIKKLEDLKKEREENRNNVFLIFFAALGFCIGYTVSSIVTTILMHR